MFERYIIVPDSLRNAKREETEGFSFDVRIAYYRGLLLSMVEGFEVNIDGKDCDPTTMTFSVRDVALSFAEMAGEADARWELNEAATVFVPWAGGLATGEHALSVVEILRVSYMPEPARRADFKTFIIS